MGLLPRLTIQSPKTQQAQRRGRVFQSKISWTRAFEENQETAGFSKATLGLWVVGKHSEPEFSRGDLSQEAAGLGCDLLDSPVWMYLYHDHFLYPGTL